MLAPLLPYYERELADLRQAGADFAEAYPRIASHLVQNPELGMDPHVERLVEGFAFLAGRIHHRLDSDGPEVAEAFLQVMYPHYLRPVPAISLLQVQAADRLHIPKGHTVLSPPVNGVRCRFRTCYDVDVWPLALRNARIELAQTSPERLRGTGAQAAICLDLEITGTSGFDALGMDRLRFFLDGDPALTSLLYELLSSRVMGIRAYCGQASGQGQNIQVVALPASALRRMGFHADEALLESDARTPVGHRLMSEYFAFPDKFMFVEISGLDAPALRQHSCSTLHLQILLSQYEDTDRHDRLAKTLSAEFFKLGCTPIVNLFKRSGCPIALRHHQIGNPVMADPHRPDAYEVYSIDGVRYLESGEDGDHSHPVLPFYSICQALDREGEAARFYWHATRRPSLRKNDQGMDLEITLVDRAFQAIRSDLEVLSLDLTCTNRDLPTLIPFGGGKDEDFDLQMASSARARLLRKPTPCLRQHIRSEYQWRLITHLSLNQLSLASQGREALQRMLQLYNLTDSTVSTRQIQGIVALQGESGTARLGGRGRSVFVRGADLYVTFDESYYVGANLFLFASVLEHIFAHACPANSFVRFHLHTKQREGEVAQWPARVGDIQLI